MSSNHARQPFDWIALLLLVAMTMLSAWALTTTEWAEDLNVIPLIALLAVWSGAALARSRFPGWLAFIFAAIYGLFITGWQLGLTLDPALIWQRRLLVLYGRMAVFASVIIVGEPNQDPLMFVLIMSLVLWTVGALSAWSAFRGGRLWGTILPGGLTIMVVAYYYLGEARLGLFLGVYLFLALILAVRIEWMRQQNQWASARARVPIDAQFRISVSGLVAAALLVVLAWGAPAFARSERLADAWSTLTRPLDRMKDRVGDAIGTLRGPAAVVASEYDDVLQLGSGTQPVNRLVMIVDPASFPRAGGRFYWRSRVYDRYVDKQWFSPPGKLVEYDPQQGDLPLVETGGRELVEVSFAPQGAALRLLYLPAEPVWVDRTSTLHVTAVDSGAYDVLTLTADRIVYEGESYVVRSAIASPSAAQLREAGTDYPEWVTSRYLQLPDTITQRTRDLADEIASGHDNPFDQVVAVTRWLRANITYDRVIDAPPPDVEPLDWFLFDYKVGFCNYYASAEVVLLRSLGIPARLAAGYARGTYDPQEGVYEVYGEDSHSWPEVFFPGVGWVEFEPTASQPVLTRPENVAAEESGGGLRASPEGGQPINPDDRLEQLLANDDLAPGGALARPGAGLGRVVLGLLALGLAVALWLRIDPASWIGLRLRLARGFGRAGIELPPALIPPARGWDTRAGRMYAAWSAWLRRLGLARSEAETARERLARFGVALPESEAEARRLVEAYMAERFGGQPADDSVLRSAWAALRGRLWLAWVWKLTARWRQEPGKTGTTAPLTGSNR